MWIETQAVHGTSQALLAPVSVILLLAFNAGDKVRRPSTITNGHSETLDKRRAYVYTYQQTYITVISKST